MKLKLMLSFFISTIILFNGSLNFVAKAQDNEPFPIGIDYYKKRNCLNVYGFSSKHIGPYIDPECAPDTLYRWVEFIGKERFSRSSFWKQILVKPIFASFSPLSTYPYGPKQMRFKVRRGVRFKLMDASQFMIPFSMCAELPKDEVENTIFVRWNFALSGAFIGELVFSEYNACSHMVFESISFFQKKSYNEMMREANYTENLIKKNELKGNLIIYLHRPDGTPMPFMPDDTPEKYYEFDGLKWDKKVLYGRLRGVLADMDKNRPLIYVNPHIHDDKGKIINRHFLTDRPTFWNSQKSDYKK